MLIYVDTERLYTTAGHQIIDRYSKLEHQGDRIIDSAFKSMLMGRQKIECAKMMVSKFQLDLSIEEYVQISYQFETEMFKQTQPMPGAAEIIYSAHQRKIPLAVATGSSGCTFEIKSKNHDHIFNRFHAIVVGDDPAVKTGKPSADIFIEAARRININSDYHRCLVIEDSPNGVKAGLAAGMRVAWVPDPSLDLHLFNPELAAHPDVQMFKDLNHLKDYLKL